MQLVANKVFENAMDGKETSAIFFLKNRDPDNWADRQELNYSLDLKNVLTSARERIIEHQAPAHALPKRKATQGATVSASASEGVDE